jgi:Ca-activated chloride channel family protein
LRAEKFEIFDNKAKQEIAYFSAENAPVTFGIVYDMHPTTQERMTTVLDSLRAFTKNLPEQDRFFLTAFNHYGSLTLDFIPTVEQIEKNLSFGEKMREPNSLYDAIYAAANKIRESPSRKKTILIISDGADHNSRHSFSDLSKQLKSLDVQIYAVIFDESVMWNYSDITSGGNRRQRVSADANRLERAALQELTMKSGGTSSFPTTESGQELYRIYTRIAAEMREFYTLSFYPDAAADGKWHELKIKLGEIKGSKKFALTYRQGYQSVLPKR